MANQCMSSKNPTLPTAVKTRSLRSSPSQCPHESDVAQPFQTHLLEVVAQETRLVRQHSVQELNAQISLAELFLVTVKNAVETGESIGFIPVLDLVRLDDNVRFRFAEDSRGALTPAKARVLLEEYILLKQREIARYQNPMSIAYNALAASGKSV
ncbi:hypothetical protein [Acanthopleuribacter pedis]|uniref:Uncharacterized protein n=1 Tax=Acanthopleuribacter pedis TaxID=442870 RepID=A0A8J7U3N6_9BACT|nr:hypothetical protein [Acanthopleuribacter pedis]MBO1317451.1 hypothetical protein [Acanthopleuribacter pedis]